jgi:hypothetical protein
MAAPPQAVLAFERMVDHRPPAGDAELSGLLSPVAVEGPISRLVCRTRPLERA